MTSLTVLSTEKERKRDRPWRAVCPQPECCKLQPATLSVAGSKSNLDCETSYLVCGNFQGSLQSLSVAESREAKPFVSTIGLPWQINVRDRTKGVKKRPNLFLGQVITHIQKYAMREGAHADACASEANACLAFVSEGPNFDDKAAPAAL